MDDKSQPDYCDTCLSLHPTWPLATPIRNISKYSKKYCENCGCCPISLFIEGLGKPSFVKQKIHKMVNFMKSLFVSAIFFSGKRGQLQVVKLIRCHLPPIVNMKELTNHRTPYGVTSQISNNM